MHDNMYNRQVCSGKIFCSTVGLISLCFSYLHHSWSDVCKGTSMSPSVYSKLHSYPCDFKTAVCEQVTNDALRYGIVCSVNRKMSGIFIFISHLNRLVGGIFSFWELEQKTDYFVHVNVVIDCIYMYTSTRDMSFTLNIINLASFDTVTDLWLIMLSI